MRFWILHLCLQYWNLKYNQQKQKDCTAVKRFPEVPFARGNARGFLTPSKSRDTRAGHSAAFRAGAGGLRAFCAVSAQRGFGDMLGAPSPLLPPTQTCWGPFLPPAMALALVSFLALLDIQPRLQQHDYTDVAMSKRMHAGHSKMESSLAESDMNMEYAKSGGGKLSLHFIFSSNLPCC